MAQKREQKKKYLLRLLRIGKADVGIFFSLLKREATKIF